MNSENEKRQSYRQAVTRLQNYLYTISSVDPSVKRTHPDGIYGEETAAAVSDFQKTRGLPVNGRVDYETWKMLLSEYRAANELISPPLAIAPFFLPLKDGRLTLGDASDTVAFLNLMLRGMSIEYEYEDEIGFGNVFDRETQNAVMHFQELYGLKKTGDVDIKTWNLLSKAFNKNVGKDG